MEIYGKVKKICLAVSGETSNGEWCKKDVVVTTVGDDPHDIACTFFGDRRIERLPGDLKEGDMVRVMAVVKSRNADSQMERWFTSVEASSIDILQRQTPAATSPTE